MLDKSLLEQDTRIELLKKAMDLSFEAKHRGVRDETWVNGALEVLAEVPALIVLVACYQEREKIYEILSHSKIPK